MLCLTSLSCEEIILYEDGLLLPNDSELAHNRHMRGGLPRQNQEALVKYQSRDLQICRQRKSEPSLTAEAIEKLSRRRYDDTALKEFSLPCSATFKALTNAIDKAHRMKVRKGEIHTLLVNGQQLGAEFVEND